MLITGPNTIFLGDLITGILVATYGGTMTASLDTWRVTNAEEWFSLAAHGPPNPATDFDLNWWTIEGIPDLGGNAFHYTGEAELTGARVKPPPLDPHQFHAMKRERRKEEESNRPGPKCAG